MTPGKEQTGSKKNCQPNIINNIRTKFIFVNSYDSSTVDKFNWSNIQGLCPNFIEMSAEGP